MTPTESTEELSNFRYSRALENSLERQDRVSCTSKCTQLVAWLFNPPALIPNGRFWPLLPHHARHTPISAPCAIHTFHRPSFFECS